MIYMYMFIYVDEQTRGIYIGEFWNSERFPPPFESLHARQCIVPECQTGSYEGEGCPLEDCKQLDKQQPHSGEMELV